MIDAYVARGGPNPLKLVIFLEEVPIEHRKIWLTTGDDFLRSPEFLRLSPHGKLPALRDHAPTDGGAPIEIFESAAILIYLAEATGELLQPGPRARAETLKWLAWQVAALGPVSGQAAHFLRRAPGNSDYACDRFLSEARRLYGILDARLLDRDHVAGPYSIADIACFPWIYVHDVLGVGLEPYPNLARWLDRVADRPAVARALREAMSSE